MLSIPGGTPSKFAASISTGGRTLQQAIWGWVRDGKWQHLGTTLQAAVAAFDSEYDQVLYEDATLTYDTRKLVKFIKDGKLTTGKLNKQKIVGVIKLDPLWDSNYTGYKWEQKPVGGVSMNFRKSVSAHQTYDWFVYNLKWLRSDFSFTELKMLREICDRPVSNIRACIAKILNNDIRSISYLYKILIEESARTKEVNIREDGWEQKTIEFLTQLERQREIPKFTLSEDPDHFKKFDVEIAMRQDMKDDATKIH